jgi:dihydroorotate dehydrogenase
LGFGFIELGTVTPRPQQGNPKPRLFRIKSELALVNSLGFNNKGVDYLVERVTKRSSKTPLGISIGKNFDTPNEEAISDYLICLEKVFQHSSYVAINISSPNTNNLRDLETLDFFDDLSSSLKEKQKILALKYGYRPLLFKISPDIDKNSLISLSKSVLDNEIDGIICSNTSVKHNHFSGKGGISGGPLLKNSTQVLKNLRSLVGPDLPIIASGGVMSYEAFKQKLDCGADLVQIYTGMIYKGTNLIKEILDNKK